MKFKSILCLSLLLAMCLQLFACGTQEPVTQPTETQALSQSGTVNLMANVKPLAVQTQEAKPSYAVAAADFAVNFLQNAYAGENCILSPYSVYMALAMCANGADAETLAQMQDALGMSAAELNVYLYSLAQNAGEELTNANSVWFKQENGFAPNSDFLQINADYYNADAFGADFDDQTLADINAWISENTNGQIEDALSQIDPLAKIYLINALFFDAQWRHAYDETMVREGVFHAQSGDQTVQMMHSEESRYLSDGNAVGFMKDYMGGQYSFVALMPDGDMANYLAGLTGENLLSTIENATSTTVFATMPKFELSCKMELKETLSAMGMPLAFGDGADFSRMSNLELKIGQVLHQTFIGVHETGTQAGASTIVEMVTKGVAMKSETVVLDRPFVMAIFDNVNQCFLFLGVVEAVN